MKPEKTEYMYVNVKLYGSMPDKIRKVMRCLDMRKSDAVRLLINQGYKALERENKISL